MTVDPEPPPARPRSRNPLASPWLTASLALIVIGLVVANVLVTNLGRLPGETPTPTAASASDAGAASPSANASPSFNRPTPTPVPTFMTYVVQVGDSLNSIATTFDTKARSIAWWNRGRYPNLDPESPTYNPGLIAVGWTLVLIPGVTVDEEHPPSPSPGKATPTPPTPSGSAGPPSTAAPGASSTTSP